MKICCISDTHGQHEAVKIPTDVDMIIHAGDWTRGQDRDFQETHQFLDWFHSLNVPHKILIAGNHEVVVEKFSNRFSHILSHYPSITYLMNSSVTIEGFNIYGSPYSNEFCGWAFMEEEVGLSKIWAQIPEDTHILVTHGPAYLVHDLVLEGDHVGSTSLTNRKHLLPDLQLHVSGHIHESAGMSGTKPINVGASVLNRKYQLTNEPIIIEL